MTDSNLDHTYAPPVNVRDFINPQFMGMKTGDIKELEQELDGVFAEAEKNLQAEEFRCNDTWKHDDVFGDVNGSEDLNHEDESS